MVVANLLQQSPLTSPAFSIAASLSPNVRQDISIQVLSRSQPISHLASTHQVSRKFIYQQGNNAQRSLDDAFAPAPADDDVLFHLPVTKSWLYQIIPGLVLICRSSYRGVVELFRDLFELPRQAVRDVCLLHRKPDTSNAYWERWNESHS